MLQYVVQKLKWLRIQWLLLWEMNLYYCTGSVVVRSVEKKWCLMEEAGSKERLCLLLLQSLSRMRWWSWCPPWRQRRWSLPISLWRYGHHQYYFVLIVTWSTCLTKWCNTSTVLSEQSCWFGWMQCHWGNNGAECSSVTTNFAKASRRKELSAA